MEIDGKVLNLFFDGISSGGLDILPFQTSRSITLLADLTVSVRRSRVNCFIRIKSHALLRVITLYKHGSHPRLGGNPWLLFVLFNFLVLHKNVLWSRAMHLVNDVWNTCY